VGAPDGDAANVEDPAAARAEAGGAAGGRPRPGGSLCRVDAWVSSTDKNFLVPVGGAIVGSPDASFVEAVSRAYPGRASVAPILDLFITFLSMGSSGLRTLLAQRKAVFPQLRAALERVAAAHGERLLSSPRNPISVAMTLGAVTAGAPPGRGASYLGSMLFSRGVSGTRVVPLGDVRTIGPFRFVGYGAQHDAYPHGPYLTAAAAMGMREGDVPVLADRLDRALREYRRQTAPATPRAALGAAEGEQDGAAAAAAEGGGQ
jgi:O-phospho-L-seryl-tRNASec:L-selenocysteinyl-tRNA synthase